MKQRGSFIRRLEILNWSKSCDGVFDIGSFLQCSLCFCRRTIKRDIQWIQDVFGVGITHMEPGRYKFSEFWFIKPLEIDDSSISVLRKTESAFTTIGKPLYAKTIHTLIRKLIMTNPADHDQSAEEIPRLAKEVSLILQGSFATMQQMSTVFQVSDRTLRRDFEWLIYRLGLPVQYDQNGRYRIEDDNWIFPEFPVSRHEIEALEYAVKLFNKQNRLKSYAESLSSLLNSIKNAVNEDAGKKWIDSLLTRSTTASHYQQPFPEQNQRTNTARLMSDIYNHDSRTERHAA